MNRRDFFKAGSFLVPTMAAVQPSISRGDRKSGNRARLRLSIKVDLVPGNSLRDKILRMEGWGFEGVELRIGHVKKGVGRALKGTKIEVCAVYLAVPGKSFLECLVTRELGRIKEVLAVAGGLGAGGALVLPASNYELKKLKLRHYEARKLLVDFLPGLGAYAVRAGTRILLHPVNRRTSWFLRLLADAAAICREVNSPGVGMMGDFYAMAFEEPSDMGAFISAGGYLHHVHLAGRRWGLPGQDDRDFVGGFKGLKLIEYRDYCSLSCRVVGDAETEILKSVGFLRDQWKRS